MHRNEEVAREAWKAFTQRDRDAMADTYAGDVTYHLGGDTAISGTHTGIDALLGLSSQVPDFEMGFELHDVVADDEHAVILFRVHHSREGKGTLDMPGAWVTHVSDGKVREIWSFPFDQGAAKEFLS